MLERAIRSVLAQRYSNSLVCIYDNASGDETEAVVARLAREDPRVKYHSHPSNIGAWENFKYGMDRVNTPYFNLLSDDDAILPGFFDAAIRALGRHHRAGLYAGATVRFAPGFISTPVLKWPRGVFKSPLGFVEILRRDFPDWNAIMFSRAVLDQIGGLDAGFENAIDLDFICRCAVEFDIIVDPVAYAVLTIGHDHLSKQMYSPARHAAYWLRILERYESADWVDDSAREAFGAARKRIGRKVFKNAIEAAASYRSSLALEAASCLKDSFSIHSAPLLLKLMTAESAGGEALRLGFRSLHSFGRAVKSAIRRRQHGREMRSVAAALALE
jgi:glycosyltransferase involved in cell wall biosynthesis